MDQWIKHLPAKCEDHGLYPPSPRKNQAVVACDLSIHGRQRHEILEQAGELRVY